MPNSRAEERQITLALLQQTADAFRVGILNLANDSFVDLIDRLAQWMQEPGAEAQLAQFSALLSVIITAQQAGNYLALADTLEYELQPLLQEGGL